MGGSAFPALDVLRLSQDEYAHLRDKCINKLQDFFIVVICPEPAPEKVDHGDVDIYVCNQKKQEITSEIIQKV